MLLLLLLFSCCSRERKKCYVIAKRANDVMTQTRLNKQTQMADDFPKTLSKTAGVPKTHF